MLTDAADLVLNWLHKPITNLQFLSMLAGYTFAMWWIS